MNVRQITPVTLCKSPGKWHDMPNSSGLRSGIFPLTTNVAVRICGINRFTLMPAPSDRQAKRQALQATGTFNLRSAQVRHASFQQSEFLTPRTCSNSNMRRCAHWKPRDIPSPEPPPNLVSPVRRSTKLSSSYRSKACKGCCRTSEARKILTSSRRRSASTSRNWPQPSLNLKRLNWRSVCVSVSR